MERGWIKCTRQGNVGEGTSERGPTWLAASKGEWTVEMWVIRIPAGIGRHEWSVTWHRNQYGQSDLVLVLNSLHTRTWPTLQHTAASTQWLKTLHLNMFLWLFHPSFISPKIQYGTLWKINSNFNWIIHFFPGALNTFRFFFSPSHWPLFFLPNASPWI